MQAQISLLRLDGEGSDYEKSEGRSVGRTRPCAKTQCISLENHIHRWFESLDMKFDFHCLIGHCNFRSVGAVRRRKLAWIGAQLTSFAELPLQFEIDLS